MTSAVDGPDKSPSIASTSGRRFNRFPVAVLVAVVAADGFVLFLSLKGGRLGWPVIAGALEKGESV